MINNYKSNKQQSFPRSFPSALFRGIILHWISTYGCDNPDSSELRVASMEGRDWKFFFFFKGRKRGLNNDDHEWWVKIQSSNGVGKWNVYGRCCLEAQKKKATFPDGKRNIYSSRAYASISCLSKDILISGGVRNL